MQRIIQALNKAIVKFVGVTTGDHRRRIIVHTNKGPYWHIFEWTQKVPAVGHPGRRTVDQGGERRERGRREKPLP